MSRKNKNKNHYFNPRPEKFHNFAECLKWLKKTTYLIVRGRKVYSQGQEVLNWITLGTGFLVAPNRFLTVSHVINLPEKGDAFKHQEGDVYCLLKHDDENNWHRSTVSLILNKNLFLYPEFDIAVVYLEDSFYGIGNKIYLDKNDFIRVSRDFLAIGSDVGVLGYPLCKLEFENNDFTKPRIGNVLMRADKGVVNCRYQTDPKTYMYEFTLAFNPGNSGGPIFDLKTGRLISIARGFKAIRINEREVTLSEESLKSFKGYKDKFYIETLNATYSFGIATPSFLDILKTHNIIN